MWRSLTDRPQRLPRHGERPGARAVGRHAGQNPRPGHRVVGVNRTL
jgi:hypothetical protein